ncbi:uncharacterized protein [Scyliorhinus torazame]|uniref:uncharacterized protein n=1 Tax=Scyliorhinus torazame TaxID=75743 RepID=UPI003B5BA5A8
MPRKKKRVRPARAGGTQRGTARQLFLFNALPPECQVYCFSFLSDVEKCRVALVCQGWSQLMRTSRLWQQADFACLGTVWGWEGALLSGARDHERWKERVENYAYHLMSRGASLLVLRASFDLGDEQTNWTQFLLRFLEGVNCWDLEELELNWTLNPLELLPTHRQPSMTQVGMTKEDQVTNFQTLLERLGLVSPGLRQASLPFDWSEQSVQLLTGFQQLKCLELKNFWVFKGVCPSSMHQLTRALPNLKRLILQVLIPVRDLEVTYTLESTSLEFLDVSQSRGLVFNLLNLPQLKELKIRKTIRGIILNTQTQLAIQSRWPCLYILLQEGVPNLRTLNHHQLLPSWQREADGGLAEVLAQACYCVQHSDTWLL